MTETEEFKSLRRLALASLGRNVLHFQRLDALLKLLVLFCDFQSPVSQLAVTHKKNSDRIRSKTMGMVVNELHTCLYGEPAAPETTNAITEACITLQFRVTADPLDLKQEKQKLSDLVSERNQLIHHDLASFDPGSEESCRDWIARLDKQNERILLQIKATQQLVDTCRQSFQQILVAANSKS